MTDLCQLTMQESWFPAISGKCPSGRWRFVGYTRAIAPLTIQWRHHFRWALAVWVAALITGTAITITGSTIKQTGLMWEVAPFIIRKNGAEYFR